MSTSLDTSHTPDEVRRQGREDWLMLLLIVGTIAAMVALVIGSVRYLNDNPRWLNRDMVVTQELNEKYVENIDVVRSIEGSGRGGRMTETITIDGIIRTDCTVPDDDNPTIKCDYAVGLTPETATSPRGAR